MSTDLLQLGSFWLRTALLWGVYSMYGCKPSHAQGEGIMGGNLPWAPANLVLRVPNLKSSLKLSKAQSK